MSTGTGRGDLDEARYRASVRRTAAALPPIDRAARDQLTVLLRGARPSPEADVPGATGGVRDEHRRTG